MVNDRKPVCGVEESPVKQSSTRAQIQDYRGWVHCAMKDACRRYFRRQKKLCPKAGRPGSYKGSLADAVYQLVGGLRSGMGYCGTPTIADLREKSQFIKITGAGLIESHPHDISITKESPNYNSAKFN